MENYLETQEESSLDLRLILSLAQKWAWVVILAGIVAGLTAFIVSKQITPVYEGTTTILINEAPSTKATDYNALVASERLARTYAQMIIKRPVLEQTIDQLGLDILPEDLAKEIEVALIRDTQLINVNVQNTNPDLAAQIANTLVDVFSVQIFSTQSERYASSKSSLESQMVELDLQIAALRDQLVGEKDPDEIDRLEEKIQRYEASYNNLALSYEQVRLTEAQSVSSIVKVEEAAAPIEPISPKVLRNTALAGMIGMLLAAGVIFLIESLNDSIRDPDEIVRRLNLPILAMIGYQPKLTEGPITQLQPRSVQAEAYRSLRTNLNYGNPDKPIKTILITSPSPANGKTTISANLAVISAQGGKKVTLVDADLHRPRSQEVFNTDNERGVSDILLNVDINFQDVMKQTKTNDLSLITSGPLIPNPSEILGTRKMRNLLQELESVNDLLVIDSPPVLSVSDALVLASHVDAVLVVVKPSEINIRGVEHTIEQIRRVGGNVIGIVLNEVKSTHTRYNSYYPGYQNYGKGYAAAYGEEKKNGHNGKKEKSFLPWISKN